MTQPAAFFGFWISSHTHFFSHAFFKNSRMSFLGVPGKFLLDLLLLLGG